MDLLLHWGQAFKQCAGWEWNWLGVYVWDWVLTSVYLGVSFHMGQGSGKLVNLGRLGGSVIVSLQVGS